MSQEVWRQKSDHLCAQLKTWSEFNQAKTILAYFSFRREPNLESLFETSCRWGFPRCSNHTMSWHVWSPATSLELRIGEYGILEPPSHAPTLKPEDVDLILVPAVACDVRGYRLGYGGGFYDRMLSLPEWASKLTIGIVFEFARLPEIPTDPWDRSLQGVCTEAGLFPSKMRG